MAVQLPLFATRDPNDTWSVRVSRRARRLSVRVYPGGRVEIVAPPGASPAIVQRFIGQHRQWIDQRVRHFAALAPAAAELPTQIDLPAIGASYRIEYLHASGMPRIEPSTTERVRVVGAIDQRPAVVRVLRRWLATLAAQHFADQLTALAAELGFQFRRLQIRRQRTRWGSCSLSGTISLNMCLLFLEPAIVRYLMIHELCHTRHMNHSVRFWSLVARCEPNYRQLDRALLQSWRTVPWWLFG